MGIPTVNKDIFNKIDYGFEPLTSAPIDKRLVLTRNEMLNTSEGFMPDVYLTVCKEDGKLYIYDITNSVDPITGKFRLLELNNDNVLSEGDVINIIEPLLTNDVKFHTSETYVKSMSDFEDLNTLKESVVRFDQVLNDAINLGYYAPGGSYAASLKNAYNILSISTPDNKIVQLAFGQGSKKPNIMARLFNSDNA